MADRDTSFLPKQDCESNSAPVERSFAKPFGVSKVADYSKRSTAAAAMSRIANWNTYPRRSMHTPCSSSDDKTFGELLELRMAIEGDAAAKVASNRSSDDWQCLDARLAAMDAARVVEEFAILDIDFHIELLRLSGNGLFASLGKALRGRWVRLAFDAFHNGGGASRSNDGGTPRNFPGHHERRSHCRSRGRPQTHMAGPQPLERAASRFATHNNDWRVNG